MTRSTGFALSVLLLPLLSAAPARADCHWAWHCDQAARCGFVPFCDRPDDKPPPLRGARLPGDGKAALLAPDAHAARKPLAGFTPVNPPPAGPALGAPMPAPGSAQAPCAPAAAQPARK